MIVLAHVVVMVLYAGFRMLIAKQKSEAAR